MLLVVAAAFGTARAQSFSLPIPRDMSPNPYSAAAGDFNGDGKIDVAVALALGGAVTIALGNGDGTFVSSITYNTDKDPRGVAVGDFNKDGKLDVAVGNFSGGPLSAGNVSILLGNGDGQFQAAVNFDAPNTNDLTAVDLNADGKLDLVACSSNTNKVTVLLGKGDGTFNAFAGYAAGTGPTNAVVADFNKDGKLDIAVSDFGSSEIGILRGNGDGTFQAPTSRPTVGSPTGLAGGDLNGDGNVDLVAPASNSGQIIVTLGNGDGTFQTPVNYTSQINILTPVVADFNGDGKLDAAVAHDGGTFGEVFVFRGNGDGTLQASASVPTQKNLFAIITSDMNLDGKPDLIAVNQTLGRINVLLNSPSARGASLNATVGLPLSSAAVATFIDYDTSKTTASFSANINWGDGTTPDAGTITADGGGFKVTGSHTYAAAGVYNVSVQIADVNGNFARAASTVTVAKADQTITFGSLSNKTFSDADFNVSATASSNLTVSFTASGNCTVTGASVHITGAGSCTITAKQAGNDSYNAAPDVPQTFQIAKAATNTALSTSATPSSPGQSVTFTATVTSTAGTPAGSVQFKADGNNLGSPVALNASGQATFTTNTLTPGAHSVTADYGGDSNFLTSSGALAGGQSVGSVFEFSQASYTVAERGGFATITVNRTGVTTQAASVDYLTDDGGSPSVFVPCSATTGQASEHCDYTRAAGTLRFAAGETQKTFNVLVNDDSYVEGAETLTLRLLNPDGGSGLGAKAASTLQITDDATESAGNPIDDAQTFVRQHYHDFLNREADEAGLAFWTGQMTNCSNPPPADLTVCKVNVSAAFFLAIEFKETGYLVERIYKAAYGDAVGNSTLGGAHQLAVPTVRLSEFLPDTQQIGQNVVVGQGDWQGQLDANKRAFALQFVQRPRFTSAFPTTLTADQFVSKLDQNAGGVLTATEKADLIAALAPDPADASKRAQVLRSVAENAALAQAESNRAFVLMEYFGYLRRNPNDVPEAGLDYTGFDFWLQKLNQFGGNYVQAEMVKAFLSSDEYRKRFGTP